MSKEEEEKQDEEELTKLDIVINILICIGAVIFTYLLLSLLDVMFG